MRSATWRRRSLVVLFALALVACVRSSTPTRQIVLVFTPGAPPPTNVHLQSGPSSGDRFLEVLVIAEDLEPLGVFAVAYEFHYPPEIFRFDRFEEYDFFTRDRAKTRLTVTEVAPGVLAVEHTRAEGSGPVPGPGSGTVMHSLGLTAIASGTGAFTFAGERALDENGGEIPGITWVGGTFETSLD